MHEEVYTGKGGNVYAASWRIWYKMQRHMLTEGTAHIRATSHIVWQAVWLAWAVTFPRLVLASRQGFELKKDPPVHLWSSLEQSVWTLLLLCASSERQSPIFLAYACLYVQI